MKEHFDEWRREGELREYYRERYVRNADPLFRNFWELARALGTETAFDRITAAYDWLSTWLHVCTLSGNWVRLGCVLLPGRIVPGDRGRDADSTVDIGFHVDNLDLLRKLGVTDAPSDRDLSLCSAFSKFKWDCRGKFRKSNKDQGRKPQDGFLEFESTSGPGPLEVLSRLSEEGRATYTHALLSLGSTYKRWRMRHKTIPAYGHRDFESLAVKMLREHGRIRTSGGIVPFRDALGGQPKNPAALRALLEHPKADRIKEFFDLKPEPEYIGEEDSVPLTDVWPGLEAHLLEHYKGCQLIRCEQILVGSEKPEYVFAADGIYLVRTDDKRHELQIVSKALGLGLQDHEIARMLHHKHRQEYIGEEDSVPLTDVWPGLEAHLPEHYKGCQLIRCEQILVGNEKREYVFDADADADDIYLIIRTNDERSELQIVSKALGLGLQNHQIAGVLCHKFRQEMQNQLDKITACSSDPERLLAAVGNAAVLRQRLPDSLLEILEQDKGSALTGIDIAEAAIATYHSDALREYRQELGHLDPPQQWAGSERAIEFVRSLGFSAEWAGERNKKRPPFLEVEGPCQLPPLHYYQQHIVDKVRNMIRNEREEGAERRGMISMPTGSGKTRVAVQAIVEAMCASDADRRDGILILWVADRDELCEQAVEVWRQLWSSIGASAVQLRISRMWEGQPSPMVTNGFHVVVATIQTLSAKLGNQRTKYEFLTDCNLVVFDEAHRSIAPTFTSVMEEIGLTRRQGEREPLLLGLTATPYRGYDKGETRWLANRYGRNRLDAGAFSSADAEGVVRELQDMKVLAQADHKTIAGGSFYLDKDEIRKMEKAPWLPQSVEDRIGQDLERTKRIIEVYKTDVKPDWPALIFAVSVEHAQTVAALLNAQGVRSRAVSGTTRSAMRRRVVEEFRRGEIQVLVNYGVFREGFDAPKTRVIVVARPVYSPNLYFQMIGRGLRGVKNGGSDRCLILNVRDTIENFDKALAFSKLDWLWDSGSK